MGAHYQPLVAPPGHLASFANGRTPEAAANHQQPQALALSSNSLVRTVNPGDRVNIPCSLANMGGSIQFAKDDQPIILDSGCVHCQLDISNDGQASLTINRVSSKDQGHWQCWRLDANGKVKQKIPIIQLVITNSPELPILIVNDKELLGGNNLDATITVKENELVNFKCLIKGASSQVDYVHWMLDSTQNVTQLSQFMVEYSPQENNYLTQSILKLNATKSMNLKSISCLSNHQLWLTPMTVTAFLNVLYEPSFTISREPGFGIPVSEGMTVILKCEIDSNPSSAPIWIKDADNKTSPSNNNNNQAATGGNPNVTGKEAVGEPIVLDTQEDGSVTFQPAQRTDSGWYRCKTENKYGNFSSFGYYLNVRSASAAAASSSASASASSTQTPLASGTAATAAPRYVAHAPFHPPQPRVMLPNQPASSFSGAALSSRPNLPTSVHSSSGSSSNNIMNNDQPSMMIPSSSQNFLYPPPPPPPSAFNPNTPPLGLDGNSALCKNNRPDGYPEIDHPITTVNAVLGRPLVLPLKFCCNPGPARVFWIHRVSTRSSKMLPPPTTQPIRL